jgi:beta-phosphoglucomutase family hydrolase
MSPSPLPAPGLPATITACLFDLDGVLTPTAEVHERAWKETFDEYLQARAKETGEAFHEFTPVDYNEYVDGLPREAGVRAFLKSRNIELPETSGSPDEPSLESIGERKQERVEELLDTEGVRPYPGSLRYAAEIRRRGIRSAVVSSSANARRVLRAARIEKLFDEVVDGQLAKQQKLKGKPAPDTFLAGAKLLGVKPKQAAVFEDALAGVAAGHAGNFGYVIGVDRVDHAQALREHGADKVVEDLAELLDEAR